MNSLLELQLRFVSDIGDKNFAMVFFTLGLISYFYITGNKKESLMFIFASLSPLFSMVLKLLFREKRPFGAYPSLGFDKYSFPSSHTLAYTAFWGYIIYFLFTNTVVPFPVRVFGIIVAAYLITMVGISRVYLGQHYVWDVAAGYIFGVLYLIFLIMVKQKLK